MEIKIIPPSYHFCVLISTGWELVDADNPLYVIMLLYITLFGQAHGQGSRKQREYPSSSVKCSRVIDACGLAWGVLFNNMENVLSYVYY